MKGPLRVGAVAAPKRQFFRQSGRPQSGKARRIASLSAAAAMVVGVGAASAIFVDYLADRAMARAAEAPVVTKPAAKADEAGAGQAVAALAPDLLIPVPAEAGPTAPPAAPIEVDAPDPEAVAKVAADVGPEHAIELPAEDPTASPIVQIDEVAAEESVLDGQPSAMEEDGTLTAAISPYAGEPEAAVEEQPKPKKARAKPAEPAGGQSEVASLPGVDIGGMAGHPSAEDDNSDSTVRTVTKPATGQGGVAADAARVTAAVNMRTSPKKGSRVIAVVPAGSSVNVLSCDGWCQISYNGSKGWVYKSFLSGAKAQKQKAAAAKPQKAATAADQAQETPPARRIQSSRL